MTKFQSKIRLLLILIFLCLNTGPVKALRLVSLKPNITMTLLALDAARDIVGITKYCPKPNKEAAIVGDYMSVNAEDIVRLKPDIILSSRENSQSRQYEALTRAGLKVEYLDFATWSDFNKSISKIGEILGRTGEVVKFSTDLESRLKHLVNNEASPWNGKSFAIIVQRQPLIIAAGETFVSSLFEHAGLKNVFAANRIAYPVLDEETFLRKSIDVIFDMTHGADSGKAFFGKDVVSIGIGDYLAAPQSVTALEKLFRNWNDKRNIAKTP